MGRAAHGAPLLLSACELALRVGLRLAPGRTAGPFALLGMGSRLARRAWDGRAAEYSGSNPSCCWPDAGRVGNGEGAAAREGVAIAGRFPNGGLAAEATCVTTPTVFWTSSARRTRRLFRSQTVAREKIRTGRSAARRHARSMNRLRRSVPPANDDTRSAVIAATPVVELARDQPRCGVTRSRTRSRARSSLRLALRDGSPSAAMPRRLARPARAPTAPPRPKPA